MIGSTINNYEVKALLGEGGMGAVYLAQHPILDRRVAIKVLRRELAEDKGLVTRFINEAKAASAIRHANIIEVFDVGMMAGGLPYLMMELLEGETLAQRVSRRGRLTVKEAIEITQQAASALAAAHDKGIVHRDLKPENLFLVPDTAAPSGERVKVLDFGIAKLRRELTGASMHTSAGSLLGTPPYMSPEQCRGVSSEIDQRTDVYAMGIILHEMLAGAPPFVGNGFGELIVAHMTQPPPRLRAIDPSLPVAIEQAVLRALEKDRDRRFANMNELRRALGGSPGGTPVIGTGIATVRDAGIAGPPGGEPTRPHTTFSSTTGEMSVVPPRETRAATTVQTRRGPGLYLGIGAALVAAGTLFFMMRGPASGVRAGAASPAATAAPPAERVAPPAESVVVPAPAPAPVAAPAIAAPAPIASAPPPVPERRKRNRDRSRDAQARRAREAEVAPPVASPPPATAPAPAPVREAQAPAPTSPPPPTIAAPPKPRLPTDKW